MLVLRPSITGLKLREVYTVTVLHLNRIGIDAHHPAATRWTIDISRVRRFNKRSVQLHKPSGLGLNTFHA